MTRKISIRAWDKKNKVMRYLGSLSAVADFYKTIYENIDGAVAYERFAIDFIFQESMGLTTYNNKDAFEGDIVKYDTNIAIIRFGKYKANNNKSYFNEETYGFYLEYISHKGVIDHATNIEYWERIGTIYENPELLQ